MVYLLPPDTKTLAAGEDTGITLETTSYVLGGVHSVFGYGYSLNVDSNSRLEAGEYKVVALGGQATSVATLLVRAGLVPGIYVDGFDSMGSGTITVPLGTFLAPGYYDVVAA